MKAILLIVLLSSAIAQQSEDEAASELSRLDARLQHLEQAIQLIAQQSAALKDQISAMGEGRTSQTTDQQPCCDFASFMVRDFNQLHRDLINERSLAVDSKLVEMRDDVQSALDHVSATEERLVSHNADLSENMTSLIGDFTALLTTQMEDRINDLESRSTATEERLVSVNSNLRENMTSLIAEFTERLTPQIEQQKDRINDLENRTSDFCQMNQIASDDFDWLRRSGITPSSDTGPNEATQGSYYAYTEMSSQDEGAVAILETPGLAYTGDVCISFDYHVYGNSVGNFYVGLSTNPGIKLLDINENMGPMWNSANIKARIQNGEKVIFTAVRGSSYEGDIAIDGLCITQGWCGGSANRKLCLPPWTS